MMVRGRVGTLAIRWPILDPGGASTGRGETTRIVEAVASAGEVKRLKKTRMHEPMSAAIEGCRHPQLIRVSGWTKNETCE